MEPSEYQQQVTRTLSDRFHLEKVDGLFFADLVDELVDVGDELDSVKKALFHGRDDLVPDGEIRPLDPNGVPVYILHGAIGLVTEAIEVLQVVAEAMVSGEPLDENHLFEEIGDCFWYAAVTLNSLGVPITEVMRANIEKLRKRYPQKFAA